MTPLLSLLLCVSLSGALVHDGLDERLHDIAHRLEESGPRADLYLRRADVLRRLGRHEEAFADLLRAGELDPDVPGLGLARGRLCVDVGWWGAAEGALETHRAREGDGHEVSSLLADAALGAGRRADAVAHRRRALALHDAPPPDLFVQLAREVRAAAADAETGRAEALAVLEEGLARLGALASLVLPAVELDREAGRWDDALERLRALVDASPRAERWLALRGDVLAEAGRPDEARVAWLAARDALDTLPAHRRSTPLLRELDAHLVRALAASPVDTEGTPTDDPSPAEPPEEQP